MPQVDHRDKLPVAVSTVFIGQSQKTTQLLLPQDMLRGAWPYKHYNIFRKYIFTGSRNDHYVDSDAISVTPLTSSAQNVNPFQFAIPTDPGLPSAQIS